jgi:hypothetical protein
VSLSAVSILERVAIVIASLVLSIGLIVLLSGYFASHDQAGVAGSSSGPGVQYRDQGDAHLRPGQPRPAYDSNPPTSGAHVPEPVLRDEVALNDDQLLEALELGNVVVMYGTPSPPPALTALATSVAGRFSPSLAAAGQAVILARRAGTVGLTAAAWTRLLSVHSATDPNLRTFMQSWLGRGAPAHSALPAS